MDTRFELFTDQAGKYRFRLKARNTELVASSEAYNSKNSALNGIDSVRRHAPIAQIEDRTL